MLQYNIKHFFAIKLKKKQAINFVLKIFYYYDLLYFIINKNEQAKIYNHFTYRLLIIIHIFNKSFENTFFEGPILKTTYALTYIF